MNAFTRWLARLGPCVLVGIFAGALSGFVFELLRLAPAGHVMSAAIAFRASIWIGLLVWLAALAFFGALAGIGIRQMALPSLVNCLAVAIVTVLICRAAIISVLFVFIGIAVGFLIGRALCAICGVYSRG